VTLTGQSQLTVCKSQLSGIELVLFLKVDFSQVKTGASVYATFESFLLKVAFKRKLSGVP